VARHDTQVDGRWVKASEEENDDMDAFGDDEELQKWGEADTYFAELPKEFDLGEDTVRADPLLPFFHLPPN
jgi:hypothetical protein